MLDAPGSTLDTWFVGHFLMLGPLRTVVTLGTLQFGADIVGFTPLRLHTYLLASLLTRRPFDFAQPIALFQVSWHHDSSFLLFAFMGT